MYLQTKYNFTKYLFIQWMNTVCPLLTPTGCISWPVMINTFSRLQYWKQCERGFCIVLHQACLHNPSHLLLHFFIHFHHFIVRQLLLKTLHISWRSMTRKMKSFLSIPYLQMLLFVPSQLIAIHWQSTLVCVTWCSSFRKWSLLDGDSSVGLSRMSCCLCSSAGTFHFASHLTAIYSSSFCTFCEVAGR